jgi:hypothetical protein
MRSDTHEDFYMPPSERKGKEGCLYILLALIVIALIVAIATDT